MLKSQIRPQNDATRLDPARCGALTLSEPEQTSIYYEWTSELPSINPCSSINVFSGAGKPHNLICSECYKPNHLMFCETCCRSYHAECLRSEGSTGILTIFHCPSCKVKKWDHVPPQFSSRSPSVFRSTTPGGDAARQDGHPARAMSGHEPRTSEKPLSRFRGLPGHQSPDEQHQHARAIQALPYVDRLAQARHFLNENGGFPAYQEYSPMLLYRLGEMMMRLESQDDLLREVQELREENARLHRGLRIPTDSRWHLREPAPNSPMPNIARPSPDTTGKSWDRIVMDLI